MRKEDIEYFKDDRQFDFMIDSVDYTKYSELIRWKREDLEMVIKRDFMFAPAGEIVPPPETNAVTV